MLGETASRLCGTIVLGYGMKPFAAAVACALLCWGHQAKAGALGPEQAAEMLAHAWMIDNRCNVLGNDDRDALTNLVARAEISLAEKKSVAAARAAIGRGRASGSAAPCDSASAKSVQDVLTAAKSATGLDMPVESSPEVPAVAEPEPVVEASAAPAAEPDQQAAAEAASDGEAPDPVLDAVQVEPVVMPRKRAVVVAPPAANKPAKVAIKRVTPPKKVAAKKVQERKIVAVKAVYAGGYGQTAEAYYKELRCRTKSLRAVNAMYAKVLREHRQAVANSGKASVRALLRAAEARAARGAC